MAASTQRKWRVTVLISGSGSNLQALLDASSTPEGVLNQTQVVHVLSSKKSAFGLERAAKSQVPTTVHALPTYTKADPPRTRQEFDADLAALIRATRPDVVVLAGWMLLLSQKFLDALVRDWPNDDKEDGELKTVPTPGSSPYSVEPAQGTPLPIINLHPALPGTFPGAHAISDAFAAFQRGDTKKTGCMVHRVVEEMDAGKAVVVKEVEIREQETMETLEERIHAAEHVALVEAVAVVQEQIKDGSWWQEQ